MGGNSRKEVRGEWCPRGAGEGSSQQPQLPKRALDIPGSRIGVYRVGQWDEVGRLLCQSLESKTVVDEEIKTIPRHFAEKEEDQQIRGVWYEG